VSDTVKISIITVVLNDKNKIENTISSVINQNIDLEYIVLDGGSTDGTLDIIEKYKGNIDIFESQKDKGIYDAMNKAVQKATGEWICFMNSGDTFVDDSVILQMFHSNSNRDAQVLYGNHKVKYPKKTRIVKALSVDNIWKGSVFSHQSCFVKREILKECKFNISNKLSFSFFDKCLYSQKSNFHS
jgi:glycosyltransferase involved in cell wall biosynthesis